MRVRYISGNQTGQIVEMGEEAAILLSNHIVERVEAEPDATDVAEPEAPAPSPADTEEVSFADATADEPNAPRPTPTRVRTPQSTKKKTEKPTVRGKRR